MCFKCHKPHSYLPQTHFWWHMQYFFLCPSFPCVIILICLKFSLCYFFLCRPVVNEAPWVLFLCPLFVFSWRCRFSPDTEFWDSLFSSALSQYYSDISGFHYFFQALSWKPHCFSFGNTVIFFSFLFLSLISSVLGNLTTFNTLPLRTVLCGFVFVLLWAPQICLDILC